jgi:WD40 repeat protein
MLVGATLFGGKTPMQSMRAHDKGPHFPAAWPADVPENITTVLEKALAREPANRYNNAKMLFNALDSLVQPATEKRPDMVTTPSTPSKMRLPRVGSIPLSKSSTRISPATADHLTQLIRLGKGKANGVTYSANGEWLAVATTVGVVLYDARTLKQVRFISNERPVRNLSIAADGTMLVWSDEHSVKVWRTSDDQLLYEICEDDEIDPKIMTLSSDRETIAAAGMEGGLGLWRVADGSLLSKMNECTSIVISLAFNPEGTLLASGLEDNTVQIWRVRDGSLLATLEGHNYPPDRLAFSPDGELLASGSRDGIVHLWQVNAGRLLQILEVHGEAQYPNSHHPFRQAWSWITSLAFSTTGRILTLGTLHGAVQLWRIDNVQHMYTVKRHKSMVQGLAFSPDGTTLASASTQVELCRVGDGHLLRELEGYAQSYITSAMYRSDDGTVLSALANGTVQLWRASDAHLLYTFEAHLGDRVDSITISPDGELVASGSCGVVNVWRVSDGRLLHSLKGSKAKISRLAFSRGGTILASGDYEGRVQIWQIPTTSLLHTTLRHKSSIKQLDFSPDGNMLISASDHQLVLLETIKWQKLWSPRLSGKDTVSCVAFSPDGALLTLVNDHYPSLRLWNVAEKQKIRSFHAPYGKVSSASFSSDGSLLILATEYAAEVYQVADGRKIVSLKGHTEPINTVTFSSDGTVLVSGSSDGTIRLWGVPRT